MTIRTLMIAGACAASMMLCACDESTPSESATPSNSSQSLSDQAKDAMNAAGDYAVEKKDQLVSTLQSQYDALQPKIEELKTKAQNARSNTSAEVTKALNELEVKRAAFEAEMTQLKDATADTWSSVSKGANDAWQSLKSAYNDAVDRLSTDKAE